MRRRFLFLIIVLTSVLFVSCTLDKSTKTIEKLNKLYNESSGYETILEMKIIDDDKESVYKMKEKYTHEDTISLEILEPKESKGIIIEYKDDKIFLSHASIKQSISLKTVKNFDKGILLANIFGNLDLVQFIEEKELDGKDYFVIEFIPEYTNKYNTQRLIYLTKKNLDPYFMEIIDENGNVRVKIQYEEFKYTEDN